MNDTKKPESMSAAEFWLEWSNDQYFVRAITDDIKQLALTFAEVYAAQENAQLKAERDHFARQNLEWANTVERYSDENAGLRKRIHHLEQHNQYFFRCESAWCNPDAAYNPALEMVKGAVERAEKAEVEIARLKQELADEYSADREIQAICAKQQDDLDRANAEIKRLKEEQEVVESNLAEYAKRYFGLFDQYRNAWLREMGGVIRPKHWEIDGFVLRMRDIYQKAQLVDRIKEILIKEVKREGAHMRHEMFDAVFSYIAESGKDTIPTN